MSPISRSSRTTSSLATASSFALQIGVFDPIEPVERRPERRERVLELVGHVGREMLDIVDPVPERLAHVGHGAGEEPDLVVPRGQARDLDLARPAEPHAMGGEREPAQGPDDGPREEQRQQNREQDRDGSSRRRATVRWLRTVRVKSRSLVVRQHDAAADRRGRREDRREVGRVADLGHRLACLSSRAALRARPEGGPPAGSMKSSSGFAPTSALNPRSSGARGVLVPLLRGRDRAARRSGRSLSSCRPRSEPSGP